MAWGPVSWLASCLLRLQRPTHSTQHTHRPATKTEPKILEEERLLIRLADAWWRSRSGSPGLRWVMVREAMKDAKVQEALASLNWKPAASDKELYAAFCAAIGKGHFKEQDVDGEQLTFKQKSERRKRDASRMRKKTAPPAITTTAKSKPPVKAEAPGAWPEIKTSPPSTRAEEVGKHKDKYKNILQ